MLRYTRSAISIGLCAGLLAALAACTPQSTPPPAKPVTLTVLAAASLTEAFTEIGHAFEAAHPGTTVVFSFGGSQQLAQQLGQGAPADVFASANTKQMDVAIAAGRVVSGTPEVFVRNRLVVIVPQASTAGVTQLQDLARPGLKIVLAAQEVPAGQYALDFLDKAGRAPSFPPGFEDSVMQNVVSYEENVRAVLSKVALGEADAGVVYSSDVGGDAGAQVTRLEIPDALNVLASYPIAVTQDSAQPELARAFVDSVLSAEGQAVLARYAFMAMR